MYAKKSRSIVISLKTLREALVVFAVLSKKVLVLLLALNVGRRNRAPGADWS